MEFQMIQRGEFQMIFDTVARREWICASPDDMRTHGRDAVEDLNVIKVAQAPA
jgi:hypothetical protein